MLLSAADLLFMGLPGQLVTDLAAWLRPASA
jgi:hypothetical protein